VISSTRDLTRAEESQRALDLSMKIRVLCDARTENGHAPGIFTGATGTSIPSSPREMWVMFDYLRPDLLRAAGVATFDAWVANHLR
jgi:N12 class adenine-specific DNA methylase